MQSVKTHMGIASKANIHIKIIRKVYINIYPIGSCFLITDKFDKFVYFLKYTFYLQKKNPEISQFIGECNINTH